MFFNKCFITEWTIHVFGKYLASAFCKGSLGLPKRFVSFEFFFGKGVSVGNMSLEFLFPKWLVIVIRKSLSIFWKNNKTTDTYIERNFEFKFRKYISEFKNKKIK